MQKIIISDASCFILFEKINELAILQKLFGTITTTVEIAKEFGHPIPPWVAVLSLKDNNYKKILMATIDEGEASAIALAVELGNCMLIMDDLKGRHLAEKLGILIIGSMGVILDAKLTGIISSVKPLLLKVRNIDFRVTEKIETYVLMKANETM